jgi:hypothetical protein
MDGDAPILKARDNELGKVDRFIIGPEGKVAKTPREISDFIGLLVTKALSSACLVRNVVSTSDIGFTGVAHSGEAGSHGMDVV